MSICIPKEEINKLKEKIKSMGSGFGSRLVDMSSQERLNFFTSALGSVESGKFATVSFEKAMISKQNGALKMWAKKMFEKEKMDEKKKASYFRVINKIDRLTDRGVLSPSKTGEYLDTLISSEIGLEISSDEVKKINDLASDIKTKKDAYEKDPSEKNRIDWGRSIMETYDYVQNIAPTPLSTIDKIAEIGNVPRTIMSSMDFSAPFRQGFGMVSRPEFWNNFKPMFEAAFSENKFKNIQADLISRPNYKMYKKAGLRLSILSDRLSQKEEAFISKLPEKIPVIGKMIEGSERAYTSFLTKLRADVFDSLVEKAKLAGEDVQIDSQVIKDIAHVVNNFTGSGNLGKNDKYSGAIPALNIAFFSPRKISATLNILNPVEYVNPATSKTARNAATRNLIGMVGFTSLLIGLYSLIADDEHKPELDPRSADFGKINIGNVHIDLTGGNANYIQLLARLITNETKSSTTNEVKKLGDGKFGSQTRFDVLTTFFSNKFSPVFGYGKKFLSSTDNEKDFNHFNFKKDTLNLFLPMLASNLVQIKDEPLGDIFATTVAETFGFGTQNYKYEPHRKE